MYDKKWARLLGGACVAALLLSAVASAAAPKPDFLWWKFDDGSDAAAKDSSGNGRDGAITGATWQVPGAGNMGACLSFAGDNMTVINQGAGTALNGLGGLTMAMWIKANATNSDRGFIIGENPAGNDSFCTMRYDAAGATYGGANVLKMAITTTGGEMQLESSAGLQTTEWQHVAMTWSDGQPIRFYSDGVLDIPTGQTAANAGTISGCTTLIVGKGGKDASDGWRGLIDDVRIYTYALTDDQVAQLLSFKSPNLAFSPSPADKATAVLRDAELAWTAGEAAQTHNVYLGTSLADVNNAGPGSDLLVSEGQTATTYTPAALAYGQTYYWRVDEVNAPPSSGVTKGEVWSFTVEPYGFPIANVTATASSFQPGMGPENTVNGSGLDAAGEHSTEASDMWLSAGTQPNWIQYEFDRVYKVYELQVWNSNQIIEPFIGFGAKDVQVEYSVDGAEWREVPDVPVFAQADGLPTYTANTTIDLGAVEARYVKLTIASSWGVAPQTGLGEVRFLYVPVQAMAPQPAAEDTAVSVDAVLTWKPGREAASHTVYFGTDADAIANGTAPAETVTEPSYMPGALDYDTTYYWRVDEVNAVTYPGEIWGFTTEVYGVVDDFEGYTDQPGEEVFSTWIDGFDNPAQNGAVVGLATAPGGTFCDTSIFHGGKASMPFAYDNTAAPLSEATLTLTPARDWTARGIKSLTLWFQGAADNTGQLYVKINNTKIPYSGAAGDLANAAWMLWNIDLSTVAGGVSQVSKLTLGVEGAGARGTLHIDDVQVSPTRLAPIAQPAITKVVRAGGQSGSRTDASPLAAYTGSTAPVAMPQYGLMDGTFVFSDRPYPWSLTPAELVGSEYVLTFNNDKNTDTGVTYTVTLGRAATVFVTADDRFTGQQSMVDRIVSAFAQPGQFQNTGLKLYIHENDTTDRPMSVYAADLPAGTCVFGAQDTGNNFYTIGVMPK
jgi:hypothetical protein